MDPEGTFLLSDRGDSSELDCLDAVNDDRSGKTYFDVPDRFLGSSTDDRDDDKPRNGTNTGKSFFKVPGKLFASGTAQSLGTSATLLYVALWEHANRPNFPSNTFETTNKRLSSETGLSPRTIRDARNRLIEKGLIQCQQPPGAQFVYTLLPQDLRSIPKEDRRPRTKRRPRAYQFKRAAEFAGDAAKFAGG